MGGGGTDAVDGEVCPSLIVSRVFPPDTSIERGVATDKGGGGDGKDRLESMVDW